MNPMPDIALYILKNHFLDHVNYDNRIVNDWLIQNYRFTGFDADNVLVEKACTICNRKYIGASYSKLYEHLILNYDLIPPNAIESNN